MRHGTHEVIAYRTCDWLVVCYRLISGVNGHSLHHDDAASWSALAGIHGSTADQILLTDAPYSAAAGTPAVRSRCIKWSVESRPSRYYGAAVEHVAGAASVHVYFIMPWPAHDRSLFRAARHDNSAIETMSSRWSLKKHIKSDECATFSLTADCNRIFRFANMRAKRCKFAVWRAFFTVASRRWAREVATACWSLYASPLVYTLVGSTSKLETRMMP